MDSQRKTTSTKEKATVEWVFCSLYFEDIILIRPKGLNDIPITSQYQEISVKQIRKKYFEVEHPRMHCVKGKDTTSPSRKSKKNTKSK